MRPFGFGVHSISYDTLQSYDDVVENAIIREKQDELGAGDNMMKLDFHQALYRWLGGRVSSDKCLTFGEV